MLTIRLVVKDTQEMILSIYEMNRFRKNGKRDHRNLEWFLDTAEDALKKGDVPRFEFLEYKNPVKK